jgi:hypothetical protein
LWHGFVVLLCARSVVDIDDDNDFTFRSVQERLAVNEGKPKELHQKV